MKQKKALEKVSEELQRTRVQLASLLAQQEAQARNNVFTLPADRFVQTIKDGAAASGTQTGSRNEHTIDSTEQLVQKTPKSLKVWQRRNVFRHERNIICFAQVTKIFVCIYD